jgi:hypothetical protein
VTTSTPTFLSSDLWARREAHFTSVAIRALELLHSSAPSGDENALNRELYFCMLRASRELDPEGIYPGPVAECCNQPDTDDIARATRESKRPDFTWAYLNPHEPDPRKSSIQFILECKRMGIPTNPQWILNSNYVEHGVSRFVDPQWGYAKRFPSALMIGYWQTMDNDVLLAEINGHLVARGLPEIALSGEGWSISSVTELAHTLVRPFPVSPFGLKHLWIDLRT